jgi:hypothetical protein
MGLDTSHNCWHGPYSSFNRFRYSLGYQIGINLDDYLGYGGKGTKDLKEINHDLMCLFNHSDCEGRLTIKECKSIVRGLNSVLDNFNENLDFDFNFKSKIIQFRDGCLDAISKRQMVKFH